MVKTIIKTKRLSEEINGLGGQSKIESKVHEVVKADNKIFTDGIYNTTPPNLMGFQKIGILDPYIQELLRKRYTPTKDRINTNKIILDDVATDGKVINQINVDPKNIKIIEIEAGNYNKDNITIGVNQIINTIDIVNEDTKGDTSAIEGEPDFLGITIKQDYISGTEEVVYQILKGMSIYKNNYWNIDAITIRVKDIIYMNTKPAEEVNKIIDFLNGRTMLGLVLEDNYNEITKIVNSIKFLGLKLKVLFLMTEEVPNLAQISLASALSNTLEYRIIMGETELIENAKTNVGYIELVTNLKPNLPVSGMPHPIHILRETEYFRIVNRDGKINIITEEDNEEVEDTIFAPTKKPTIISLMNVENGKTEYTDNKVSKIIWTNSLYDLPFIFTAKSKILWG